MKPHIPFTVISVVSSIFTLFIVKDIYGVYIYLMGKITDDDIQYKLEEINSILGKRYRLEHPERERHWRTYEQQFSRRIKMAMKDIDPLVSEAVSTIHIIHGPEHPHSLTLEQRVKLLLIKQLVGESNRMFANMLDIFSMLSGIDVS